MGGSQGSLPFRSEPDNRIDLLMEALAAPTFANKKHNNCHGRGKNGEHADADNSESARESKAWLP
jgi:hypothetical protein